MFDEIEFPQGISYGSSGGPGWATAIFDNDASVARVARRSQARHEYNAGLGIRSASDVADVIRFYLAREGSVRGWRWKDWADFTSAEDGKSAQAVDDVEIGAGDGATTEFQLVKKYVSGAQTYTRIITKPEASSVLIAVNAVTKTEGADFTVDTTTGVVTFTVAPTAGHAITAGFEFRVPAIFGEGADKILDVGHLAYDGLSIPAIPIIELPDPTTEIADDFPMGGWYYYGDIAANVNHTFGNGRGVTYNPTVGSLKIILPDETSIANGGPIGFIRNESGANTLGLYASDGTTLIATIAISSMVEVVKRVTSGGTRTWDVF